MVRVLIVEGDATLRASISESLSDHGWQVVAATGQSGLHGALAQSFDIIVLGFISSELTARHFLVRLRAEHIETPVLLISSPAREQELVDRLESGADGYLVKPISLLVLHAQIRALLRRGTLVNRDVVVERQVLRLGTLTVDLLAKKASVGARSVELSKREFALLRVLADHPHAPLSKEELLQMAWGDRCGTTPNAVEVYIGYLRKRLRTVGASQCIETCRGRGYQLNAPMWSDGNRTSLPNGETA